VPSVTAWQPSDIPLDTLSTREDDSRHFVIWGALMDIVVWLRSLGLWKYEAAFRENEIDETVLANPTAENLREIGVGPVGHRPGHQLLIESYQIRE
jgi:hypothetical protein